MPMKSCSANDNFTNECPICYEDLLLESDLTSLQNTVNGRHVKRLKCSHQQLFHLDCLTEWLVRNSTCPYCRAPSLETSPTFYERFFSQNVDRMLDQVSCLAVNILGCGNGPYSQ